MTDMPMFYFKETLNETPAKRVEEILDKIYSLYGSVLSQNIRFEFEYYLHELLNYVTLIHMDIIPSYDPYHEQLVYFFNEDVIQMLGVQLLLDNNYNQGIDRDLMLFDISEYKRECIENNKCLVYDFNKQLKKWFVNQELSNFKQLPAVYSVLNKNVIK